MKFTKEDVIGILLFYLVIILGVIGVNARFEQLCENGNTYYCPVEK